MKVLQIHYLINGDWVWHDDKDYSEFDEALKVAHALHNECSSREIRIIDAWGLVMCTFHDLRGNDIDPKAIVNFDDAAS